MPLLLMPPRAQGPARRSQTRSLDFRTEERGVIALTTPTLGAPAARWRRTPKEISTSEPPRRRQRQEVTSPRIRCRLSSVPSPATKMRCSSPPVESHTICVPSSPTTVSRPARQPSSKAGTAAAPSRSRRSRSTAYRGSGLRISAWRRAIWICDSNSRPVASAMTTIITAVEINSSTTEKPLSTPPRHDPPVGATGMMHRVAKLASRG